MFVPGATDVLPPDRHDVGDSPTEEGVVMTALDEARLSHHFRRMLREYERVLRRDCEYSEALIDELIAAIGITKPQQPSCDDKPTPGSENGQMLTQDLLSIKDVAAKTSLSEATVEREIADGRLKSFKVRNRRIVHAADLETYIAELRSNGANE
jgi:excisionase family DNA binding protein